MQVLRSQAPGSGTIALRFPYRIWGGGGRGAAREAFLTRAFVKLQPMNGGAQVEVTLRSHYFVAANMTVWIAVAALFNVAAAAVVVYGVAQPVTLVVSLLVLGMGISFIPQGRFFARSDRAALLDFVSMVLSVP
jgi:hypothetical protein